MYYTIRQLAEMFQTTEHTIRYYTDIGLLPCQRDGGNRRVFDEESVNWMQGITCLKGCGASIEEIKKYCELCKQPESKENLEARYQIILEQREEAYKRLEEAKATADYMEKKVVHYQAVLNGNVPDDTNPGTWTTESRPEQHRKKEVMVNESRYIKDRANRNEISTAISYGGTGKGNHREQGND